MSGLDVLLDPVTGDLPDYTRHATGMAIVAQRVRLRLGTHLGEPPLKRGEGIDWMALRVKGTAPSTIVAIVAVEIANTPGVASVQDIDFEQTGDRLVITASVLTDDGEAFTVVLEPVGIDGNPSVSVGAILGLSGAGP